MCFVINAGCRNLEKFQQKLNEWKSVLDDKTFKRQEVKSNPSDVEQTKHLVEKQGILVG